MNKDSQEVIRLLNSKLKQPDMPGDRIGSIDYDLASLMASNAVNERDPEHRVEMVHAVAQKLVDGSPLLIPERAWLLYVLAKIGAENLPNECKGRSPIFAMDHLVEMCQLGAAMLAEEPRHPKNKTKQLVAVAGRLGKSYESVRAMYYSGPYKSFSKSQLFDRLCGENAIANK